MGVATLSIAVGHERRPARPHFERVWPSPPGISGKPFRREDGAWTRNVNGFDLAEIVCQHCVVGNHFACIDGECTDSGYSCCPCNGQFAVIGAATAANGKETP
jgi:hypothetical protein